MSLHEKTIQTYNASAAGLAEYFSGHGARTDDIDRALKLANANPDARVIEIGCGDGRDAAEIVPRVGWYEGFDPSEGLLNIARTKLPGVSFVKADAHTYRYPPDIDVCFAFASLLHVNQEELPEVFEKAAGSLRPGGIFYLALKERPEYAAELQTDQFGDRMFFFYNPDLIQQLAGSAFSGVYEDHYARGNTEWFRLALQKV